MERGVERLGQDEALRSEVARKLNVPNADQWAGQLYKFIKNRNTREQPFSEFVRQNARDLGLDGEHREDNISAYVDSAQGAHDALYQEITVEHPRLREELAGAQDKLRDTPFFTEASYGAKDAINELFAKQEADAQSLDDFGYRDLASQQIATLNALTKGAKEIDETTADIHLDFFVDIADSAFAGANATFADTIRNGDTDYREALGQAQTVAENIRAERKKYETAEKFLSDPNRLERSVDHCLADEQNLLDLQKDPQKIFRLLRDRYGVDFDTNFVAEKYLENRLVGPYVIRVETAYKRQLESNKNQVMQAHAQILREANNQNFASRAEYEAFVQSQMQAAFPDQKNSQAKKYMPDSEWDRLRARNMRAAEQAWEAKIETGQARAWTILDAGLDRFSEQRFASESEFVDYVKALSREVQNQGLLPDEVWDDKVGEKLKTKATAAYEKYLEKGTEKVWSQLDGALKTAETKKFNTKAELIDFIKTTTTDLNQQKLIPDERWNQLIAKDLRAKVDMVWTKRDLEKKTDSERVASAMATVSLSHKDKKPRTAEDFYRIAKENLPNNIKGKLTDSEWDAHMRTHFYPRIKTMLKENEGKVQSAMESAGLPNPLDFKNQTDFVAAAKLAFSQSNPGALGIIPNNRYDVLRDRFFIPRAKEAWRSHEQSEGAALDKARAAMNDQNLLGTVHHFAKNKGVENPTSAAIKASSAKALVSQFGLRPDQLKSLEPELNSYAAQAVALHKSRRHAAQEVVQKYQVPKNLDFTSAQLSTPTAFYEAIKTGIGDMQFIDINDWYLVEKEAMAHIEALRMQQLALANNPADTLEVEEETSETTDPQTEVVEEGSQELTENLETNMETPAEKTPWMKRFGLEPEGMNPKGVERFNRVMQLPEFNLGGIPPADLKIAVPVLVNMLAGFRETTWKNFTLRIRQDMRGLESKDPQSRLFQILKSFATGYPYKPTDFDVVPGLDNVFNNLVKRTKNPDGERFITIKSMYLHYFSLDDRLALDQDISEEDFEAQLLEVMDADGEWVEAGDVSENISDRLLATAEDLEEDIETVPLENEIVAEIEPETEAFDLETTELETEESETVDAESVLEEKMTEVIPAEIEDAESEDSEAETKGETNEVQDESLEAAASTTEAALDVDMIEPIGIEAIDTEAEDGLLEAEDETTEEVSVAAETVEEDAEEEVPDTEPINVENTTETSENFSDYLQPGAEVLTEVDQIMRHDSENREDEGEDIEQTDNQVFVEESIEELRPVETKAPLAEAAEVVPEKLYKHLLKLHTMGLLSDEAISWLLEQGTEFAVVDDTVVITLDQALRLLEISLQNQFLARNLRFEIKLGATVRAKVVLNFEDFMTLFTAQFQATDGLRKLMINGHRGGQLRGYFDTKFGKKSFAIECQLGRIKKSRRLPF